MKEKEKSDKSKDQKRAEFEPSEMADGGKTACEGSDLLDREAMGDDKYIEALEERLGQCMAETLTCRNLTQRLQADFDNYRKRNSALAEEMRSLGEALVIEKMLAVLDNCDLARKYVTDESALTGFNMMQTQIIGALEAFGLKEIEADQQPFDVKTMNAVEREKSEGNEGKVIAVISKGYTLKGKVLRPAGVKVGG